MTINAYICHRENGWKSVSLPDDPADIELSRAISEDTEISTVCWSITEAWELHMLPGRPDTFLFVGAMPSESAEMKVRRSCSLNKDQKTNLQKFVFGLKDIASECS